jgi:hypothetical protein
MRLITKIWVTENMEIKDVAEFVTRLSFKGVEEGYM